MPIVTHSKALLGQPPGLVAFPRDGEENRPRRDVESQQGNAIVAGQEELGSPSPTCAAANGSQCTPGFGIFKGATKSYFTHYSCVVIVLFNRALRKYAFSTVSFRKLVFGLFLLSVFFVLNQMF